MQICQVTLNISGRNHGMIIKIWKIAANFNISKIDTILKVKLISRLQVPCFHAISAIYCE